MIANTEKEIYSSHFSLYLKDFTYPIFIYSECSKNVFSCGNNDYYSLELFFSVEEYGAREFLIGLNFGHKKMDKQSLDKEILAYLDTQLDDSFPVLIERYLKKEQLLEEWLGNLMHS